MTVMDPRLKDLIMDMTAQVIKDTGLDKKSLKDLTPQLVAILCDRMVFEIKARRIEFFDGLGTNSMKEHFDVIDESVKEVKKQFEREGISSLTRESYSSAAQCCAF